VHNEHFTVNLIFYKDKQIDMKKLCDLINPDLLGKAELLAAMSASVHSRLPQEIAAHCWIGGYEKDHIVLITDYPHHAIYMRCHQREILTQLKEEFSTDLPPSIRKVRIKVSRILSKD